MRFSRINALFNLFARIRNAFECGKNKYYCYYKSTKTYSTTGAIRRVAAFSASLETARRRYVSDQRGVAALEFALLAPLVLVLCIAGVVVGEAVLVNQKVSNTAYTLADLVSQFSRATVGSTTSTQIGLSDAFKLASLVMTPFPGTNAQIILSALTYDGANYQTVWSVSQNAAAYPVGKSAALDQSNVPPALTSGNGQILMVEVFYSYKTPFASVMSAIWGGPTITLSSRQFARPRMSNTVDCDDCPHGSTPKTAPTPAPSPTSDPTPAPTPAPMPSDPVCQMHPLLCSQPNSQPSQNPVCQLHPFLCSR